MPDRFRGLVGDDLPRPLSWGASFDPDLVRDMAAAIGASMRDCGVHQGLAPVLDVTRDLCWAAPARPSAPRRPAGPSPPRPPSRR
ncbi:MAG TPA: glycoside hydrolase family 3 N-terminal domain-containing protein [Streptosporangiaceae bacterium]|nr:glycoside hydrolase family 3 N-terminal domain-containing protein [Streptosporangiaceae bacterium]